MHLCLFLGSFSAAASQITLLRDAIRQLDEPFLVVVVGEFNSGKSSVINSLLVSKAVGRQLVSSGKYKSACSVPANKSTTLCGHSIFRFAPTRQNKGAVAMHRCSRHLSCHCCVSVHYLLGCLGDQAAGRVLACSELAVHTTLQRQQLVRTASLQCCHSMRCLYCCRARSSWLKASCRPPTRSPC